jgi:predicted metal-dependent peptidase|tara:strand:+ start:1261 stop:2475 length:1215 start_codon:yes stop_codon:yes gene_type:complete
MSDEKYNLEKDIYHLLNDEPYFAVLSRSLDKRRSDTIPTAGIKFNPKRLAYELVYNPEFMRNLPDKTKKWVLMHELYHASLGHCEGRKLESLSRKVANICMDMAINSLPNMISGAPDFVIMPGRKPFEMITALGQSADWYAEQLKMMQQTHPEKFENDDLTQGQFDDHGEFHGGSTTESEEMGKQIADRKMQEAIAKAVKECEIGDGHGGPPRGWGSVSHQTRTKIKEASLNKFKLDPKMVLASFIKASVAADKKTSVTKRNRRLPGKKFGKRVQHRANIAISIDQSGSVSDELLAKVFTWLSDFAKFASFTVVPFDHQVFEEKVYVWKKGEKRKRERVLYGGTDFDAPTNFVNQRNFDGHIVITDMMAPKPIRSKCQRMWLTDRYGDKYGQHNPVGERKLVLD